MENEVIFDRAYIIDQLLEEFESVDDFYFPDLFLKLFEKYLSKIYDFEKLEFCCDPYILGEKVLAKDEYGYDCYKAPLVICEDPFSLGPDDKIWWLSTMKIYYKNDKILPREYIKVDCATLRAVLVELLIERPEQIFESDNPMVDVFLNVLTDMAEFKEQCDEEPPYPYNQ
jgi:hypothetical protein